MRRLRDLRARLSLTARLTIFFAAMASFVVLGLGTLVFLAVNQHFADMDHEALAEKRLLIEDILQRASSADDARRRLEETLGFRGDLLAEVSTADGGVIYRSPSTASSAVAAAHDAGLQRGRMDRGAPLRSLSFASKTEFSALPVAVWMGLDTHLHAQFLRLMQRGLLAYMAVAIALSALLAWLAARQALAPLQHIRSRAAVVAGSRLDERMPVASVPPEMAELARELNQMLDRLQQDFERLAEFSADIAHELRTPLTNLLTQTQVTLSTARDPATYQDVLGSNAEELEWLGRMVSDMLFLAKAEHGIDLPDRERFSAHDDAHALLEFHAAVAEEKCISMTVEGAGDIVGDRSMFRRAISNLLSNALRHAPEGGTVRIRIENDTRTTTVSVENTGEDIPPDALPRLFDRFYRAGSARTHAGSGGTGLGLAIVQAIAHIHGGTVSATSADGYTCFAVVFPRLPTDWQDKNPPHLTSGEAEL